VIRKEQKIARLPRARGAYGMGAKFGYVKPLESLNHDLPEQEFFEANEQVAMKLDKLTSLLYSPFVPNLSRITATTVTFS
jgi:hypothetical protein